MAGNRKKLSELNASWIYGCGEINQYTGMFEAANPEHAEGAPIGVSFDCPCGCGIRVMIPLDCPPERNWCGRDTGWEKRSVGWELENLTVHPSIDGTPNERCSFHGWVRDGEVTW